MTLYVAYVLGTRAMVLNGTLLALSLKEFLNDFLKSSREAVVILDRLTYEALREQLSAKAIIIIDDDPTYGLQDTTDACNIYSYKYAYPAVKKAYEIAGKGPITCVFGKKVSEIFVEGASDYQPEYINAAEVSFAKGSQTEPFIEVRKCDYRVIAQTPFQKNKQNKYAFTAKRLEIIPFGA